MEEVPPRRFKLAIPLALTALAVGFFFIVPDLVGWWRIDGFKTPFRAEMGDETHYLTHLNRLRVEGISGSSMFTWEHRGEKSRFLFFEKFIQAVPGFKNVPAIWWHVILKFFSAATVFLGLFWLFRACGIERRLAFPAALTSAFFYNPYAMQGPALSSWFLIFFLPALALFAFAAVRQPYAFTALAASVLLLFASGMHAIFFLAAAGAMGLWWLTGVVRNMRDARVWAYAIAWAVLALLCFWLLFGEYLGALWGGASAAPSDFFERNGALRIRFLHFPLLSAKFALLALAAWIGYRQSRSAGGTQLPRAWLLLVFLALAAFAVTTQNIVTGLSFLGGHFTVLEEFIVLPMAASVLFLSLSQEVSRASKFQKIFGVLLLAVAFVFAASLLIGRPIRSWLVLGRWTPLLTGYFIIGWWLYFPRRMELLALKAAKLLSIAAIISIAYAGVFLWRSYVYDAPWHVAAQRYREVFAGLSRLPAGVVMASPDISELVALYTPHRVYWSRMNGQFGGTYEELSERWLDEWLVFDGDERLGGDFGRFSIFGGANQWCDKLTEKLFYGKLRGLGLTRATTCNTAESDRSWPGYLAEYGKRRDEILRGGDWQPPYRLDWLLAEAGKDHISEEMRRYFEEAERVGDFVIYRYRGSRI